MPEDQRVRLQAPGETMRKLLLGANSTTYSEFRRFNPGGVADIQADQVLAPGLVEDYVVLPGHAGLLQLMNEGRIERLLDGIYLIKKPIARFPAGLTGSGSVTFMLGKGVPMPAGSSGHSCVLSEETGKSLVGKRPGLCLQ